MPSPSGRPKVCHLCAVNELNAKGLCSHCDSVEPCRKPCLLCRNGFNAMGVGPRTR